MMFLTRRPGPPLSSSIEKLWYYRADEITAHTDRVLPDNSVHLTIDLATGGAFVTAPRSHYVEIRTGMIIGSVMGVVFRPGAARAFFEPPASELSDKAVSLDGIVAHDLVQRTREVSEARDVQEKFALLESLLDRLQRSTQSRFVAHASVAYALEQFRDQAEVKTVIRVSKEAGLSRRRFSQLFREQVGMSPKRYCRLLRFHRLVRQIDAGVAVDWAQVALSGGYYDQSHLAHEFRQFSGMTPGSFLAAERPFTTHIRVE